VYRNFCSGHLAAIRWVRDLIPIEVGLYSMPSRILKMAAAFAGLHGLHGTAMANDWQNATALEHAVPGSKNIHVALDLSGCVEHDSGKPGPDVRGSLHPDEFMVQKTTPSPSR
jgi:hypothetical protein